MNIGQGNFPILTSQQTNPTLTALSQSIAQHLQRQASKASTQGQQLLNQRNQATLPYAGPQAAATLQATNLSNEWFAPEKRAQIANQDASTQNLQLQSLAQKIINQYLPQKTQADIASTQANTAETNLKVNNPGLLAGGVPSEIAGLNLMGLTNNGQPQNLNNGDQQNPSQNILSGPSNAPYNTGNPALNTVLNKDFQSADLAKTRAEGYSWQSLPADSKTYALAQAAGMGIDPTKAAEAFSHGATIEDMAKQNGFDPNKLPDPDFTPTKGNISTLKQRQSALKEVDSLSDFVTKGLGPYAQTIGGMSPKQIADAITNQNPDQQAQFLAARMLAPELSNIRLKLAQAPAGINAADEIMNKSLMNVGAYQSLVTPEVFKKSQELANEALKKAFTKSEEAYKIGGNKSDNNSSEAIISPKVQAAMKKYGISQEQAEQIIGGS